VQIAAPEAVPTLFLFLKSTQLLTLVADLAA